MSFKPPKLHSEQDWVVLARDLGKYYSAHKHPTKRLRQLLWQSETPSNPIHALTEVCFKLQRGRVLGVIGNNGAGKSTLLQLICGTLSPTSGTVQTQGKIAALLELGAGFNSEFTGYENIFLNAALLGYSRQKVSERIEAILEFAGLGASIEQPLRTYSTGMAVRLAFSVATAFEPDLLVIDEALSVGDGSFAKKSFDRIMFLRESGCSILFCSHSMYHVESISDEVLWLDRGKVKMLGPTTDVTRQYILESIKSEQESRQVNHQSSSHFATKQNGVNPSPVGSPVNIEDPSPQATLIEVLAYKKDQGLGHILNGHSREALAPGNDPYVPSSNKKRGELHPTQERITLSSGRDSLVILIRHSWHCSVKPPSIAFSIECTEKGILITSGSTHRDLIGEDTDEHLVEARTQAKPSLLDLDYLKSHAEEHISTEVTRYGDFNFKLTKLTLPSIPLLHGRYSLNIFLACERGLHVYDHRHHAVQFLVVQNSPEQGFFFVPRSWDSRKAVTAPTHFDPTGTSRK